jgi:DNA helicase HerA-like ATPase
MTESSDFRRDVGAFRQELARAREAIRERLVTEPLADSADGHSFMFRAPVTAPLPTGGYVRIQSGTGAVYFGQIVTRDVTERDGPEISLAGDSGLGVDVSGLTVANTAYRVRLKLVQGAGTLLGRFADDRVLPTSPDDLFEDAAIETAGEQDVERYLRSWSAGRTTLDIGSVRAGAGATRALIRADGFDRHTFLCGQSGSGKTYALGVMLERLLLETDLRIVIIDPNSDFVHLNALRSFEEATRGFGPELSRDAYEALAERYRAATDRVRVLRPAPRGTATPDALRVRFSDLAPIVQGIVLQIDPLRDREEYHALRTIVSRMGRERYSLSDLSAAAAADLSGDGRQLALRIANLGVATWDIWAEHDEASLADGGLDDWRALVLDVGGFNTAAEKSLVASAVMGVAWGRRNERAPMLIVIDEAHNVCAQEPSDPLQAAATERAIRIAGEGRKFGIYLLLATQRPQKLHSNVISQCDNLVLMRMNSAADVEELSGSFSFVPASLLAEATSFRQGESLIAGKIAPSPLFTSFGGRLSREGGSDVPTDWAAPRQG